MPGAGGPARAGWSHGWVVLPEPSEEGPGVVGLWHLPPRGTTEGGSVGATDGAIRRAKRLAAMPEAIVATAERVYLVFPPEGEDRRVLSLSAFPGHFPGTWVYVPGGRLRVHEPLPGTGQLAGLGISSRGVVALLDAVPSEAGPAEEPGPRAGGDSSDASQSEPRPEPASQSKSRLLVLEDEAWRKIALPSWPERAGAISTLRLLRDPSGPAVLGLAESGRALLATTDLSGADPEPKPDPAADLDSPPESDTAGDGESTEKPPGPDIEPSAPSSPISPEWAITPLPEALAEKVRESRFAGAFVWRDQPVVFHRTAPGQIEAITSEGDRVIRIASVRGVEADFAVAELRDTDRAAVVWLEKLDPPTGPGVRVLVTEFSLITGQTVHEGEGVFATPISPAEFRMIALSLLGLMALVLVYVLRGVGEEAAVLVPEGWALAPGGARIIALAADAILAGGVCSIVLGIPVAEAFTVEALTTSRGGHWALPLTLGIGTAMSAVLEWLTGRTPGKLIAGIRVVRAQPNLAPPTLWAALVRNVCKWWLAPVAVLALADPNGRHRGDVQAHTVVVAPIRSGGADHPPQSGA